MVMIGYILQDGESLERGSVYMGGFVKEIDVVSFSGVWLVTVGYLGKPDQEYLVALAELAEEEGA